jgi:hypothetical protein
VGLMPRPSSPSATLEARSDEDGVPLPRRAAGHRPMSRVDPARSSMEGA